MFTLSTNLAALDGAQAILEYRHKTTDLGPSTSNSTNALFLRLILIL